MEKLVKERQQQMRIKILGLGASIITISFITLHVLIWSPTISYAQKLTPEMLAMPREEIRFSDNQLRLFNGRGCIYVKQYSLTGMHAVQFPPIDIRQYQFRIDFRDDINGILMQDNIPELWEDWKAKKSGYAYSPLHLGVKSAKAKAVEAKAKLAETRAGERSVRIREAERDLASARLEEVLANLTYAKHPLKDTFIRAPMAGRVTKKTVEVGQFVHPGQPLMAIVSLNDLWIVANFKETQLTHIRPGQKVKITVDTHPGEVFTGTVDSIQAGTGARFSLLPPENATGNFVKVVQRIPVKIVLDKQSNPGILRLGMSVVPTIELR